VHAFLLVFIINGDCLCLIPYLYDRDAFCEIGIKFLNVSDIYRSFHLCRVGLKNISVCGNCYERLGSVIKCMDDVIVYSFCAA
jgi:hypothetical protein